MFVKKIKKIETFILKCYLIILFLFRGIKTPYFGTLHSYIHYRGIKTTKLGTLHG